MNGNCSLHILHKLFLRLLIMLRNYRKSFWSGVKMLSKSFFQYIVLDFLCESLITSWFRVSLALLSKYFLHTWVHQAFSSTIKHPLSFSLVFSLTLYHFLSWFHVNYFSHSLLISSLTLHLFLFWSLPIIPYVLH